MNGIAGVFCVVCDNKKGNDLVRRLRLNPFCEPQQEACIMTAHDDFYISMLRSDVLNHVSLRCVLVDD